MFKSGIGLLVTTVLMSSTARATADEPEAAESRRAENERLFRTLDRNADGELTADEFEESRKTYFDRLIRSSDVNNDGKLARAEFLSGIEGRSLKPVAGVQPIATQTGQRRTQGSAQEFFKRLDRNGDGKLSLDEFPEAMRDRIKVVMDRLNVDTLTFEQMSKLRAASSAGRKPQPTRRPGQSERSPDAADKPAANGTPTMKLPAMDGQADSRTGGDTDANDARGGLLQVIDRDRDGRVTREEWERLEGLFAKLDRNGDGVLDKAELTAFGSRTRGAGASAAPAMRSPASKQRPPQSGTRATGSQMVQAFMKRLDKDQDGRISKSEATRLPPENFKRIDSDGDGYLTPRELETARTNRNRE